jgi:hypothetical protein
MVASETETVTEDMLEDMRTALHENIISELNDDIDTNQSEYRYVYEVVYTNVEEEEITTVRYYSNAVDCNTYLDYQDVTVYYKKVPRSSPFWAMAYHNSNVERVRVENGISLEAMIPTQEIFVDSRRQCE